MIKHSPTGELSGEFVRGQIALDSPHVTLVVIPVWDAAVRAGCCPWSVPSC